MFEVFFLLFKQKTAYEMRISDWSSDVCSSDLREREHRVMRKAAPPGGSAAFVTSTSERDDSFRLGTLGALRDLELDPLGLLERPVPVGLNRGIEIGRASCRERGCR